MVQDGEKRSVLRKGCLHICSLLLRCLIQQRRRLFWQHQIQYSKVSSSTCKNLFNAFRIQSRIQSDLCNFNLIPVGRILKWLLIQYSSYDQYYQMSESDINLTKSQPIQIEQVPQIQKHAQSLSEEKLEGVHSNGFDDLPISKSQFNIPAFAEQEQSTNKSYTLSEKLNSKAAKLRLEGLGELCGLIGSMAVDQHIQGAQIQKILKETAPLNIDAVANCFRQWVQKGRPYTQDEIKLCIENVYLIGKDKAKTDCIATIDFIYSSKEQLVQSIILGGLKSKLNKIVIAYLTIVKELLKIFGISKLKFLKPYYPDLIRIITNEKQQAVRSEAISLIKEAYKWMGKQTVDKFITDLKEPIKKELDLFWSTYDKSIQMKPLKQTQEAISENNATTMQKIYDMSEPVDIFKKYNEKWADGVIKTIKWNDKCAMLEEFIKAASVPKIANVDFRHISELIKRLINDSNFNVVLCTLKMIAALAKGLRRHFYYTAKTNFFAITCKFRDKKTQMIEESYRTLQALSNCLMLQEFIEELRQGFNDKNVNMKCNLIKWVVDFIKQKIENTEFLGEKIQDALKQVYLMFLKLQNDGSLQVREAVNTNLERLREILGEQLFSNLSKKKAIKANTEPHQIIIEIKPPGLKQSKISIKSSKQIKKKEEDHQQMAAGSMISFKKTIKKEAAQTQRTKEQKKAQFKSDFQNIIAKINDKNNWQKRKEGAEELGVFINENHHKEINWNEILKALKPRLTDSNKQLIKLFAELTAIVFSMLPEKQLKLHANSFIATLIQGLNDKTEANRMAIELAIKLIAQIIKIQNFLAHLGGYLANQKINRVQVLKIILNFQESLPNANLKDYPKGIISCLSDKNKEIRELAQTLFAFVYEKIGANVFRNLAKNLKPIVSKDINAFLDRFDPDNSVNSFTKSATMINLSSPSKIKKNPVQSIKKSNDTKKLLESPPINEKRMMMKNKTSKILSASAIPMTKMIPVVSDEYFMLQLIELTKMRVSRQLQEENKNDQQIFIEVTDEFEDTTMFMLTQIFTPAIIKLISSPNYKTIEKLSNLMITLMQTAEYRQYFREVHDILCQWIYLKMFGGQIFRQLMAVACELLQILVSKKIPLSQIQLKLYLSILRQYLISITFCRQYEDNLSNRMIKQLISVSSGEKIVKFIIIQINLRIQDYHNYLKKSIILEFKDRLCKIIAIDLVQFLGNQEILKEISTDKILKASIFLNEVLFNRFNPQMLFKHGITNMQADKSQADKPPKQQKTQNQTVNNHKEVSNQQIEDLEDELQRYKRLYPQKMQSQLLEYDDPPNEQKKQQKKQMDPSSELSKKLNSLSLPMHSNTKDYLINYFSDEDHYEQKELYAEEIVAKIFQSLQQAFQEENRYNYHPEKVIELVYLFQKCMRCASIATHLSPETIYAILHYTVNQLVSEDQNKEIIIEQMKKRKIKYEPGMFVKAINSVVLRILEFQQKLTIFTVFIKLLTECFIQNGIKTAKQLKSNKYAAILSKCITKMAKNMNITDIHYANSFLFEINRFFFIINLQIPLSEVSMGQQNDSFNQIVIAIRKVLLQIANNLKDSLWQIYSQTKTYFQHKDIIIQQYLEHLSLKKSKSKSNEIQTQELNRDNSQFNEANDKIDQLKQKIISTKQTLRMNSNFEKSIDRSMDDSIEIKNQPLNQSQIDEYNQFVNYNASPPSLKK